MIILILIMSDFKEKCLQLLAYCRESRKLVLIIVAIGLLLDNMLLTAVGKIEMF